MFLIGDKIKIARKNKGMSQDDLAKLLGVNRVSISNYEKGKNNPTHANLLRLSDILGVELLETTTALSKLIPLIGLASCGVPKDYNLTNYDTVPIDDKLFKDGMYAVEAEGDSMTPKINDRNIVYCSPNDDINNGNIVHYTFNGESGIKKYKINEAQNLISLIPLNSDYDIVTIDEYDSKDLRMSKVVGVVDTDF